jgi:basic membrane protein A
MKFKQLSMTIAALFIAGSAMAQAPAPKLGIVYDAGGKFDKSFNQSAFEGAERFKKETNIPYIEVQANSDTQAEQVMRGLARKKLDMIAAIGFSQTQAVAKVAKEFPKVKFVLIDSIAPGANVNSIMFKEQEGSYLVGVAAAMAWNDPAKGGELARQQFDRGADVVFAVAGGSGMGALQMAKEKGKLAIGVDSNQNYLHPGSMLSSMVKRVDVAIYDSFMQVKNNTWKSGTTYKGLKEGGVDWVLDKDNRKVVSPEMEKRVNGVKADIISGKIKVIDYRAAGSCPV